MKITYKKILVPLDGSKQSEKALLHARDLSKNLNSKLYLFSAVDSEPIQPFGMQFYKIRGTRMGKIIEEFVTSAFNNAHRYLSSKTQECKKAGIDATYKVVAGTPTESILGFSKRNGIDLIVIGSVGLGGIKKIKAIGSVSRKVSENAICPVLIVH